eukprot:c20051_g1_i2.p1 GENE.c20051_g1_i2~~c20051_g1_i2.p1  ORF type:complete len:191 (+),score=11.35 c20051_g1_i2:57-629(+)
MGICLSRHHCSSVLNLFMNVLQSPAKHQLAKSLAQHQLAKCTKLSIVGDEKAIEGLLRKGRQKSFKSDHITLFESTPGRCVEVLNSMITDHHLPISGCIKAALCALQSGELNSEIVKCEQFTTKSGELNSEIEKTLWVIVLLKKTARGNLNFRLEVIEEAVDITDIVGYLADTQILRYSKQKGVYEYLLE